MASYELPPGVELDQLSPEALEGLASILERKGSLPFVKDTAELQALGEGAMRALAEQLDAVQRAAARRDNAAFVQYAIRAERDDSRIVNAPHHEDWHRFFDAHRRAILFSPVEHGKTQHMIGRIVKQLGDDPNKRIAVISNTAEPHARKIVNAVRQHIEQNPRVRALYPNLRPSTREGDPWGQFALTVQRDTIAKEPSLQGSGLFGPINGARLDGVLLDDILDFENTRTPEQIAKVLEWLDSTVFTRVQPDGWVWWIGTPWNPQDPMHQVAKRKAWASKTYSAVLNPDDDMDSWKPLWPQQFPVKRLQEIFDGTTPLNFARKYLCRVRDDGSARFQQQWIDTAKALGKGRTLLRQQPVQHGGAPFPCFTGVDLGIGRKKDNDQTVLFTVYLDERGRRVVADIQAGRWSAPDILARIAHVVHRFASIVYVEDVGAQDFLLQWASEQGLPVKGYTTTAGNKYSPEFGIESLAVEMRNGQWVIPSGATGQDVGPEVEAWISEMLFYDPNGHTGDRLMASWFAREAVREFAAGIWGTHDTLTR